MNFAIEARKLANYIITLENDFTFYSSNNKFNYNHIGALLTNIVLQAGLNYNSVVKPRVNKLLLLYPEINTTKKFKDLIDHQGLSNLIDWQHHIKLNRIYELIQFLLANNINTCVDFKIYLLESSNHQKLMEINGVGPKTVDYLLKLLNFDVVAVDRHINSFVQMAEIETPNYIYTKKTVEYAADFLSVSRTSLDYSIWSYMSKKEFIKNNITSQLIFDFA
jgi:endonuclease III